MKKTNRTFKRFAAITSASLLAACAVAPVAVSAADITIKGPATGSIYDDTTSNHTYEAYQIFTGTLSGGTLSDIDWGSGVNETSILGAVQAITLDDNSKPFENCDSAEDVAALLVGEDSEIVKKFAAAVGANLGSKSGEYNSTDSTITGLENGYYLVQDVTTSSLTDSAKTRYLLDVAGSAEVNIKASYPTVMKKVQEESLKGGEDESVTFGGKAYNPGDGYNDVADYDIGDDVPFKLYGTLPSGIIDYDKYYYCFRDTLGTQFDAPDNITVKIANTTNDILLYYKWNENTSKYEQYTSLEATGSKITENADTNCNVTFTGGAFAVAFKNILSYNGVSAATKITVSYSARLNETANVGYDGQVNSVYIEHSNNPNQEYNGDYDGTSEDNDDKPDTSNTTEDGVIVFTYGFDINKVITGETTKLADAYFAVYYETDGVDGEGNPTKIKNYIKTDVDNCFDGLLTGKPAGTIKDGETTYTASNAAGIWKSDTTGNITILGLDKDKTYYVEELKAPATYNALKEPVAVTIASSKTDADSIYQQDWTYSLAGNIQNGTMTAVDNISINNSKITNADGNDIGTIKIENSQGSTLPGTGGIGTTIFYLGGGAMAAIGGIYLISKRRMKKSEE